MKNMIRLKAKRTKDVVTGPLGDVRRRFACEECSTLFASEASKLERNVQWPFRVCMVIIFLISHFSLLISHASLSEKYNKQKPAVIVCNISYAPGMYLNENGQPDGYFVDLITLVLDEMKIPYQISPQEINMGREFFITHQADIVCDHLVEFDSLHIYASKFPISYPKIVAASRKDENPINSLADLRDGDVITVKRNSYIEKCILDKYHSTDFTIERHAPREALASVSNGSSRCFIWDEEPMKWQLHALQLENIRIDYLDLPVNTIHIITHDKELTDAIDDIYARLQQQGRIQNIYDKWFHPERIQEETPYSAVIVLLVIAALGATVFLLSRLMRRRIKQAVVHAKELNHMMEKALGMGDYYVTKHDLETDRLIPVFANGLSLPKDGMPIDEFMQHVPQEMHDEFREITHKLSTAQMTSSELRLKWHPSTDDNAPWQYMHGYLAVEMKRGKPRYIVCAAKNITAEKEEEERNNEQGERFFKFFETNFIAMSFYDKDGMLIEMNQSMKELCGANESNLDYFRKTCLFDLITLSHDLKPGTREKFQVCQHLQNTALHLNKYLEMHITPTIDEDGALVYYVAAARDVTDERNLYLTIQKQEHAMQLTNNSIKEYERQLEFLLEKSDMFVWQFDFATRDIRFSRSLRKVEFSMNRSEYIQDMVEEEREGADHNLMAMIMKGEDFNAVHHFNHLPNNPNPCWYALSGVPARNANGQLTGYFGVARNITALMEAQQKLKQETTRAENSGRQKSAFLANMSHEIRTPLNAIVGFSDLLPLIDNEEERMEFIRIISNNCDMLLRLINDILEASSMTTGAISITPTKVDFAQVFNDICQTLAQRVQEPGVEFIKDNPYQSFITTIDKDRMQQVITNFVTNAVKYTHEGHIKVGYRYEDGGIHMYCEDTGDGIPQEKQASVFERFVKLNDFVQGTGLGLSICKAIADRSGGRIGVKSDGPGHGSTFWMWVPCEVRNEI